MNGQPVQPEGTTITAQVGQTVSRDGNASQPGSSPITGYAWDLGGGQTATTPAMELTFPTPGTYPATLTVTDQNGLTDTKTRRVQINE